MTPQICITGTEDSLEALEARILRHDEANFLHEIRVDFLQEEMGDICRFIASRPHRALVTLRTKKQGGHFPGSPSEYATALRALARCNPTWLDVEFGTPPEAWPELPESTRSLLSHHDFTRIPFDVKNKLVAMEKLPCDAIKLAVSVNDAADLLPLLELGRDLRKPHQLIGMGLAGILSRIRFHHFGNLWTFVSAGESTAPGQCDWAAALSFQLPQSAGHPFLSLVGGPQIIHSPGPTVYNRIFRTLSLPYCYVPAVTTRPIETFDLLERLGAMGASVTMPHKEAAFTYGHPDSIAAEARAANTLRFADRAVTLTDVPGVAGPMEKAGVRAGERALILGSGGFARAAAMACRSLGVHVTFAVRDIVAGKKRLGEHAQIVPWSERHEVFHQILINATPVVEAKIWEKPLTANLVMDAAISQEECFLLQAARAQKINIVSSREVWAAQGAAQMKWLGIAGIHEDDLALTPP